MYINNKLIIKGFLVVALAVLVLTLPQPSTGANASGGTLCFDGCITDCDTGKLSEVCDRYCAGWAAASCSANGCDPLIYLQCHRAPQ
jgi:hypothetical protein